MEVWSFNPLHCGAVVASRPRPTPPSSRACVGFNPLHCGAVVASGQSAHGVGGDHRVSIPFIAGQWSLLSLGRKPVRAHLVSIPFIAGQWSLPTDRLHGMGRTFGRFNPLHCGAVVASLERL